jgi:hypothetical protein
MRDFGEIHASFIAHLRDAQTRLYKIRRTCQSYAGYMLVLVLRRSELLGIPVILRRSELDSPTRNLRPHGPDLPVQPYASPVRCLTGHRSRVSTVAVRRADEHQGVRAGRRGSGREARLHTPSGRDWRTTAAGPGLRNPVRAGTACYRNVPGSDTDLRK